MTEQYYKQLPSMLSGYKRALLQKPAKGDAPDELVVKTEGVSINRINLQNFQRLTGEPALESLPITYLHILAAPLHIQLLTHPEFPHKAMGCVHVRNTIIVHQHVTALQRFDIEVSLGEQRLANKGTEFDLHTSVRSKGELVWEEITTVLAPGKGKGASSSKKEYPQPHLNEALDRSSTWNLPSTLGIQYARVCGDFNPIHLFPLTAKLFGFQRQIIHGMWTVSKFTAQLHNDLPALPFKQTVSFKRPITLPQRVHMGSWLEGDQRKVQVFSTNRKTVFVDAIIEAYKDES